MKRVPIILGLMVLASMAFGQLMFQPGHVAGLTVSDIITSTTGLVLDLNAEVVTLNGSSNVSVWADQSGNGNHFYQSTAAWQPAWFANAINGKAAVFGKAGTELISTNISNLASFTNRTMFIVARRDLPGATYGVIWHDDARNNKGLSLQLWDDGTYRLLNSSATRSIGGAGTTTTNTQNLYTLSINSAGYSKIYLDGSIIASNTGAFYYTNACAVSLVSYDGSYAFCGPIARVLQYNRTLTPAEQESIQDRLKTLYGTP